jgi:hypothetical protein
VRVVFARVGGHGGKKGYNGDELHDGW